MKKHIKIYSFLLFFFVSAPYTYSQTAKSSKPGNGATEQNQPTNNPGDLNLSGDGSGSPDGQSSESGEVPASTENELLNTIINNSNEAAPVHVKGTRLPNEYSSGRTGGQYSFSQNPATAKPKPSPESNLQNSVNSSASDINAPESTGTEAPESESTEEKAAEPTK